MSPTDLFLYLNDQKEQALESIEMASEQHKGFIKKEKIEEAKRRLASAFNYLTGKGGGGRLSERELARIVEVVKDIPVKGRKMVIFMEAEDGSGLIECITGKPFPYE